MNEILIAPPAGEPVTLAEAKAWLRMDTNAEDDLIATLIAAARRAVEAATRRALMTQSWRVALDAWPFSGDGALDALAVAHTAGRKQVQLQVHLQVDLRIAPLASVSAIRVTDSGGQQQLLPASLWRLAGAPDRARVVFSAAPPDPGVTGEGIAIDVVAGYGAAGDVPAPLRQAILMLVADWFEHRGDDDGANAAPMPRRVAALLAPYRRGRLA